jgi:hypothetical protein
MQYSNSGGVGTYSLSYMQALVPSLAVGGAAFPYLVSIYLLDISRAATCYFHEMLSGVGQYTPKKGLLRTGFGAIFDNGDNLLGGQWGADSNVRLTLLCSPLASCPLCLPFLSLFISFSKYLLL